MVEERTEASTELCEEEFTGSAIIGIVYALIVLLIGSAFGLVMLWILGSL